MRKRVANNGDEEASPRHIKTYFNNPPSWFSVAALVMLIIFISAAVIMMPHLFASMERSQK
jgi:uncharacterized membrane protein YhdT